MERESLRMRLEIIIRSHKSSVIVISVHACFDSSIF